MQKVGEQHYINPATYQIGFQKGKKCQNEQNHKLTVMQKVGEQHYINPATYQIGFQKGKKCQNEQNQFEITQSHEHLVNSHVINRGILCGNKINE